MEPQNLQTASSYINNLLLSRGLLRNGVAIEFATPSKVEGGVDATMAKVMNLVHDLILRRDVSAIIRMKEMFFRVTLLILLHSARNRQPLHCLTKSPNITNRVCATVSDHHTP